MASQIEKIKWIERSNFIVDGFNFQHPACRHYFLTHYHSDHTTGLNKSFGRGGSRKAPKNLDENKKRSKDSQNYRKKQKTKGKSKEKEKINDDNISSNLDKYYITGFANNHDKKKESEIEEDKNTKKIQTEVKLKEKRKRGEIEIPIEEREPLEIERDYIYTSCITATLLVHQMKISREHIRCVEIGNTYQIEKGKYVSILDANHCPGSIMFLFHDLLHPTQHISPFRSIEECLLVPFPPTFENNNIINQKSTPSFTEKGTESLDCRGSQKRKGEEISNLDIIKRNNKVSTNIDNVNPGSNDNLDYHETDDIGDETPFKSLTSTAVVDLKLEPMRCRQGNRDFQNEYDTTTLAGDTDESARKFAYKFCDSNKTIPGILHTGDFRAADSLIAHVQSFISKYNIRIEIIYLDTTYCNKKYIFPDQRLVLDSVGKIAQKEMAEDPSTLFFIGTYSIGKERCVKAVARAISSKIYANPEKEKILRLCGEWDDKLFDHDPNNCRVRMAWIGALNVFNDKEKTENTRKQINKGKRSRSNCFNNTNKSNKVKQRKSKLVSTRNPSQNSLELQSSNSNKDVPNTMKPLTGDGNCDYDNDDAEKERVKNALEKEQPVDEEDEKLFDNEMSRCTNIVGIRPTGWSFRNDRKPRFNNHTASGATNRKDEDLGVLTKYKPYTRFHEDENSASSSFIGTSSNLTNSNADSQNTSLDRINPRIKKTKIYSIPYSEHSSYEELRNFIKAFKPKRIIPTVNVYDSNKIEHILGHFLNDMDLSNDKRRLDSFFVTKDSTLTADRKENHASGTIFQVHQKVEKTDIVDLQDESDSEDSEVEIVNLTTSSEIALEKEKDIQQEEKREERHQANCFHKHEKRNTSKESTFMQPKRYSLMRETCDKDGVKGDIFVVDYDTECSNHEPDEKRVDQFTVQGMQTTMNVSEKSRTEMLEVMDEEVLCIGVGSTLGSTLVLSDTHKTGDQRKDHSKQNRLSANGNEKYVGEGSQKETRGGITSYFTSM